MRSPRKRLCRGCQQTFFEPYKRWGRARRYCSQQCKDKATLALRPSRQVQHNCANCQKSFVGLKQVRYCSRRCGIMHRISQEGRTILPRECAQCRKSFTPRRQEAKYCSTACGHLAQRKPKHEKRASLKLKWARDLAKRRMLLAVQCEDIQPRAIFERDNWICGICKKRVGKKYRYPHPLSACLDHIMPISKGGTYTARNVQCAHNRCNSRKSNHLHAARTQAKAHQPSNRGRRSGKARQEKAAIASSR